MANMQQDFEVARQQAQSQVDAAFGQIEQLQEEVSESFPTWSYQRQNEQGHSHRSLATTGLGDTWSLQAPARSWSMHSHSSSSSCGAVAALFARSFHHTNFMDQKRLRLSLAWPVLYSLSDKFRKQFLKAFRGLQQELQTHTAWKSVQNESVTKTAQQ
ncbi:hypothetical protein WJX84_010478 [Apatococcus fuscideae]|uniref:Uncharacterized protein n=1 Tax=Apatococcus fuscideae TaxID=2026836 RepID=A0AAW1T6U7_9CHLO